MGVFRDNVEVRNNEHLYLKGRAPIPLDCSNPMNIGNCVMPAAMVIPVNNKIPIGLPKNKPKEIPNGIESSKS